jgi:hydroxymethylpyrimidine pyrophosphatase-like HAD family hydrolase
MGVAMGNAVPEVQSAADRVAGTHDSSAIADMLTSLVLAN